MPTCKIVVQAGAEAEVSVITCHAHHACHMCKEPKGYLRARREADNAA